MLIIVFAAAALLADVPSSAPPSAVTPPPAAPALAAKVDSRVGRNGLICRNEAVLGSRFPRKVCFTPADLAVRTRDDRADLERVQSGHK